MRRERAWRLPLAARYALIQLPELALVAIPLYLMVTVGWLPARWAWIAAAAWVVKDALLYPLYRHALRDAPPHGVAALVGCEAEVIKAIAPVGQVRLQGERWRARSADGATLPPGRRVVVVGYRGLTLEVRAVD